MHDPAISPPIQQALGNAVQQAVKANSCGRSDLAIYRTGEVLKNSSLFEHPATTSPLQQQLALALARVGALDEAAEVLRDLLVASTPDGETFGLLGSVCKRLSESVTDCEARELHLRNARDFYDAGFTRYRDPYCAINAAACHALLGDHEAAAVVAGEVLALPPTGDAYWDAATRAEALLLRGMTEQALTAYSEVVQKAGDRWADLGTTRKQCRKICANLSADPTPFDALFGVWSVAMVSSCAGHSVDRNDFAEHTLEWLRRRGAICVWISVGTDPIVGIKAIEAGIETCVVLPAPRSKFTRKIEAQECDPLRNDWQHVVDNARTVVEMDNSSVSPRNESGTVLRQMTKNAASRASALSCPLHGLVCGPDELKVPESWQHSGVIVDVLETGGGTLEWRAFTAVDKGSDGHSDTTADRSVRTAGIFRALVEELSRRRYR